MGCTSSTTNSEPKSLANDSVVVPAEQLRQEQSLPTSNNTNKIIIENNNAADRDVNFTSGLIFIEAQRHESDTSIIVFGAIKRGDLNALKIVINKQFPDQETNVHALKGMWDSTPLMVAIQYHHIEIIQYLLSFPPHDESILNHRNEKGATAILFAVMEGMHDVVQKLIALNTCTNVLPTSEAVYNPHYDQLMMSTPLSIAICNNELTILRMLISHGCNVDQKFVFPLLKSTLSAASKKGNSTANKVSGILGLTPIALGCFYGHVLIVEELLNHSCNCHVTDNENNSILHHLGRTKASSSGEIIKHTVQVPTIPEVGEAGNHGDTGLTTEDGPSEESTSHPIVNIFQRLQKRRIITDELLQGEDSNGDLPLHVACDNKQHEYVKLLLQEGCNPSSMNKSTGLTPLHLAVKRRSLPTIECLLEYGADPLRKQNDTAQSPYDLCSKLPKTSEVFLMMEKAANAWQAMRSTGVRQTSLASEPTAASSDNSIIMREVVESKIAQTGENATPLTQQHNETLHAQEPSLSSSVRNPTYTAITITDKLIEMDSPNNKKSSLAATTTTIHESQSTVAISLALETFSHQREVSNNNFLSVAPNSRPLSNDHGTLNNQSNQEARDTSMLILDNCNDISLINLPEEVGMKQPTAALPTRGDGGDPVSEFSVLDDSMTFEYFDPLTHRFANPGVKKLPVVAAAYNSQNNRLDMYIKSYNPSLLLRAKDEEDDDERTVSIVHGDGNEEDERSFMLREKHRMKAHDINGSNNGIDNEVVENSSDASDTNHISSHQSYPFNADRGIVALAETIASEMFRGLPGHDATDQIAPTKSITSNKGNEHALIPKPPSNSSHLSSVPSISSSSLSNPATRPATFRRRQLTEATTSTNVEDIPNSCDTHSVTKGEEVRKSESIAPTNTNTTKPKPPRNNPSASSSSTAGTSSSFRRKLQPPKTNESSSTNDVNNSGKSTVTNNVTNNVTTTSGKSGLSQPSPLHRRKLATKS